MSITLRLIVYFLKANISLEANCIIEEGTQLGKYVRFPGEGISSPLSDKIPWSDITGFKAIELHFYLRSGGLASKHRQIK